MDGPDGKRSTIAAEKSVLTTTRLAPSYQRVKFTKHGRWGGWEGAFLFSCFFFSKTFRYFVSQNISKLMVFLIDQVFTM